MSSSPIGNTVMPAYTAVPVGSAVSNSQQPSRIPPVTPAEKSVPAGDRRQEAGGQPSPTELATSMVDLNRQLQELGTNLQFSVDNKYGEMVIKVMDTETREIIRQIPAEEALAVARFFRDLEDHLTEAPRGRKSGSAALAGVLVNTRG